MGAIRVTRPPKKNGAVEHAKLARLFGQWLLAETIGEKPAATPVGTPLPSPSGVSGFLQHAICLLIRTLIVRLNHTQNETKLRATGAAMLALADLLEALELSDTPQYWLRD